MSSVPSRKPLQITYLWNREDKMTEIQISSLYTRRTKVRSGFSHFHALHEFSKNAKGIS